jgi:hypothetical protein
MRYSPTKKPFDLEEFLSQKATRRGLRWNRGRIDPSEPKNDDAGPDANQADIDETSTLTNPAGARGPESEGPIS